MYTYMSVSRFCPSPPPAFVFRVFLILWVSLCLVFSVFSIPLPSLLVFPSFTSSASLPSCTILPVQASFTILLVQPSNTSIPPLSGLPRSLHILSPAGYVPLPSSRPLRVLQDTTTAPVALCPIHLAFAFTLFIEQRVPAPFTHGLHPHTISSVDLPKKNTRVTHSGAQTAHTSCDVPSDLRRV